MNKKVLIVGGVAGGATAAARLRRLDESAEVIIFERGDYVSYANCGLPYFVGDVIDNRENLLLQTPESMKAKYNIDVRTRQEVIKIDRVAKTVTIKDYNTNNTYKEPYDKLLLAMGSSPLRPPVAGIESEKVMNIWTVNDISLIKEKIRSDGAKSAIIVGGGFIGLEMAENLRNINLDVTLVEMLDQVMAPLDYEMAQILHEHLEQNGINLVLKDGVASFEEDEQGINVILNSGRRLSADLAILAVGVKPNSQLARDAGLAVNARGGIIVDEFLRTSDQDIYAVGDVIEVEDFVDKNRIMVPLAGPANKQGRIAANNIAGAYQRYEGTQGTAIVKVFDLTAACTGNNERTLLNKGMVKGRDFETLIINQNHHAAYYPGAKSLTIKLLFSMDGRKIYGAQIVGAEGVDKRIDIIAVTQRLGGGIDQLKSLELAYAPPYSSAKDPVNMAGFVAENVLSGKVTFCSWDAIENKHKAVVLDVREDEERRIFSLPSSVNIPLGQLRSRLYQLDKEREIIVMCAAGVRAYNAACILQANGFADVKVYPGGIRFYQATHYKKH